MDAHGFAPIAGPDTLASPAVDTVLNPAQPTREKVHGSQIYTGSLLFLIDKAGQRKEKDEWNGERTLASPHGPRPWPCMPHSSDRAQPAYSLGN